MNRLVTESKLRQAAQALINDVMFRHPGEDLRCPYMKALRAALEEPVEDDGLHQHDEICLTTGD